MQQHSTPSHSKHLLLPPLASAGLMMLSAMDVAALPGPLLLTKVWADLQAIFRFRLFVCSSVRVDWYRREVSRSSDE